MVGILILAALVVFIAVIAVRTIRFTPKPQPVVSEEAVSFDKDGAVDALAQLMQNLKSLSPCCRNCIPMYSVSAISSSCPIGHCSSAGPASRQEILPL